MTFIYPAVIYDFLLCPEIKKKFKKRLSCKFEAFISSLCRTHYWMAGPCIHCQNWSTLIANRSLIPGWGQRQHTAAWRPVRANPVARQQFTDGWEGSGLVEGSSTAAHAPACPSSSSRQDWICNLPGLKLLIWFFFFLSMEVLLCWSHLRYLTSTVNLCRSAISWFSLWDKNKTSTCSWSRVKYNSSLLYRLNSDRPNSEFYFNKGSWGWKHFRNICVDKVHSSHSMYFISKRWETRQVLESHHLNSLSSSLFWALSAGSCVSLFLLICSARLWWSLICFLNV